MIETLLGATAAIAIVGWSVASLIQQHLIGSYSVPPPSSLLEASQTASKLVLGRLER